MSYKFKYLSGQIGEPSSTKEAVVLPVGRGTNGLQRVVVKLVEKRQRTPSAQLAIGDLADIPKEEDKEKAVVMADAEMQCRAAIKRAPNDAEAHFSLACVLENHAQYPEAEVEYRATIALDPNHAKAHYSLASLLSDLHRTQDAEVEYAAALEAEMHTDVGDPLRHTTPF